MVKDVLSDSANHPLYPLLRHNRHVLQHHGELDGGGYFDDYFVKTVIERAFLSDGSVMPWAVTAKGLSETFLCRR